MEHISRSPTSVKHRRGGGAIQYEIEERDFKQIWIYEHLLCLNVFSFFSSSYPAQCQNSCNLSNVQHFLSLRLEYRNLVITVMKIPEIMLQNSEYNTWKVRN